ncbi:MAG: hypothetical protein KYX66_06780 [Blastomonas fulva]|uniref:hypothetical protein n=1 Tax=Blastomonas fulva TaxID=1550728 RepID=UPI0024E1BE01|nr:hypothetical protein [Blastomonas fulva]MDK2756424.1 hypothetical protein [Blastomonas fulva]
MSYQAIASKFRRALRNGTGASFTLDQLHLMADAGILNQLAQLEADELRSRRHVERAVPPMLTSNAKTDMPGTASELVKATVATVLADKRRRK